MERKDFHRKKYFISSAPDETQCMSIKTQFNLSKNFVYYAFCEELREEEKKNIKKQKNLQNNFCFDFESWQNILVVKIFAFHSSFTSSIIPHARHGP